MTSVSMVDWKMEPSSSRRQRICRALVRVPLWPMAMHQTAVLHHEGLGVDEHGGAGGGIAHVADGQMPRQLIQDGRVEDLGHQPQAPVHG